MIDNQSGAVLEFELHYWRKENDLLAATVLKFYVQASLNSVPSVFLYAKIEDERII